MRASTSLVSVAKRLKSRAISSGGDGEADDGINRRPIATELCRGRGVTVITTIIGRHVASEWVMRLGRVVSRPLVGGDVRASGAAGRRSP